MCYVSCTYLVTSFKKGILRALRKKGTSTKNIGGGGGGGGGDRPPCPPCFGGPVLTTSYGLLIELPRNDKLVQNYSVSAY